MKNSAILFLLLLFSLSIFAQRPKSKADRKPSANPASKFTVGDEKEEFEKAVTQADATERIAALQKFVRNFSKSEEKTHALELIVSARAEIADEKLRSGDAAQGVELFKLAVAETPQPVSDKLFTEIILQIPTNLFFRGQQSAAFEVAKMIEEKTEGNAKQLLGLATFYLGTENASEARRLAEKVIAIEPNSPAAYQTLGMANRLNFQLEDAATAYAKALELDKDSIVSKRSLAEMKRATGKTDEAVALYREILAKNPSDISAQTGLILSLFDAENTADAEAEMQKSLEQTPNNLSLLVGAAYWYAAHNNGAKSVELAEKAVSVEPRYTWAHIAKARGLLQQHRPLDAERALLVARQYGNFPTLNYEIAAARLQAGFFREAAEELKKNFIVKNGTIETRLGGRVPVEAKNFIDLLALERRASIFEPNAADSLETAQKLKSLLDFSQKLEANETDETTLAEAADELVKGDDKMKLHRELFVASRLLEKKAALPKVLELAKLAVTSIDSSLDVANPAAAVLADELYESRTLAISRGELVIVPEISRQTLSSILRGRIEEITGWALFQQDKPGEAAIRLKRAVSVLPEKSAWWRISTWQLGAALDADGKSKEALDAYIKSYTSDAPDMGKRIIIESLYQKINGSLDGLDQKIGAKSTATNVNPASPTEANNVVAQTAEKEKQIVEPTPIPEIKPPPIPSTVPVAKETPQTIAETKPTPEVPVNQNKEESPKTEELTKTVELPKTEPTPETTEKPAPEVLMNQNTDVLPKIEALPKAEPTPETKEPKTKEPETKEKVMPEKPVVVITTLESKQAEAAKNKHFAANPEKTLFDPIVIAVPKIETPKKASDENPSPTRSRKRIADEKKDESQPSETREKIKQCTITASQQNVSLLNAGGSLSILLNLEGEGNLAEVKATSSNSNDVEVALQPEVSAAANRTFFVIKSISQNKGEYSVKFELPCGKTEVSVKVN